MARLGLTIGINKYQGAPLRGCVNDAHDWAAYLQKRRFKTETLIDEQATKETIFNKMVNLVANLAVGDHGVIFFAGHGTWQPDVNGDEVDGRDEALCPFDCDSGKLLLDDELSKVWVCLRPGAQVTFITDSCHSGTVLRFCGEPNGKPLPRYLPPGNLPGGDNPANEEHLKIAARFAPQSLGVQPVAGLVHFGACQDAEYAGDAVFGGRPNGAFSHAALNILNKWHDEVKDGTYLEFYRSLLGVLPNWDNQQTPTMNAISPDRLRVAF